MSGNLMTAPDERPARQEVFSPDKYQVYPRGRAIKSCLECRRRKMRCSRSQPCQNCSRFQRHCVYLQSSDCSSPNARPVTIDPSGHMMSNYQDENSPTHVHEDAMWRAPSIRSDSAKGANRAVSHDNLCSVYADGDTLNTGSRIGRLRITEHMGDLSRAELGKRISLLLASKNDFVVPQVSITSTVISQQYKDRCATSTFASYSSSSETSIGTRSLASHTSTNCWEDYFPSRKDGELLYYQYFAAVDPLAHILHKPSFALDRYNLASRSSQTSLTQSFKALLLAVYFAAAASLPPMQCLMQLGIEQEALMAKLNVATEKALIDADYMNSTKLETLQAFTIYMTPQCRFEIFKSHTIFVGSLVRLARFAGLHGGGADPAMSPTEIQVRRLLWHQICFLDQSTAESQGSQPVIREEETDTPLPWNVDDTDVDNTSQRLCNNGWTDATFTLMRYECCILHRLILRQRLAINNKVIAPATVRRLINERKRMIEAKYLGQLDERIPIQRCARVVGRILTASFESMLLQRHPQDGLERLGIDHELRNILIESGLSVCENAALLETSPDLAPWTWYAGAHQQYHHAIFLLMEVYRNPNIQYAGRVNAVLDFVFENPHGVSSVQRNRDTLRLLAEKLASRKPAPAFTPADRPMLGPNPHTHMNGPYIPPNPQINLDATTQQIPPVTQGLDEYQDLCNWQTSLNLDTHPTPCFASPDMSD